MTEPSAPELLERTDDAGRWTSADGCTWVLAADDTTPEWEAAREALANELDSTAPEPVATVPLSAVTAAQAAITAPGADPVAVLAEFFSALIPPS